MSWFGCKAATHPVAPSVRGSSIPAGVCSPFPGVISQVPILARLQQEITGIASPRPSLLLRSVAGILTVLACRPIRGRVGVGASWPMPLALARARLAWGPVAPAFQLFDFQTFYSAVRLAGFPACPVARISKGSQEYRKPERVSTARMLVFSLMIPHS